MTKLPQWMLAIIVVVTCLGLPIPATAWQGVREIPSYQLNDIAMATHDGYGPVIIYNPRYCDQVGQLVCLFYRAHEYGHFARDHFARPISPQLREAEADCWAAQNAPPNVVQAGYQWFISGGGSTPSHGWGPERAARLKACFNGF